MPLPAVWRWRSCASRCVIGRVVASLHARSHGPYHTTLTTVRRFHPFAGLGGVGQPLRQQKGQCPLKLCARLIPFPGWPGGTGHTYDIILTPVSLHGLQELEELASSSMSQRADRAGLEARVRQLTEEVEDTAAGLSVLRAEAVTRRWATRILPCLLFEHHFLMLAGERLTLHITSCGWPS